MRKILVINPGSTSTKIAVYENEKVILVHSFSHSADELKPFVSVYEQYRFRRDLIIRHLENNGIASDDFAAVVGRGGMLRPVVSGVYEVNDRMLTDLQQALYGEHASNLGAIIAHSIAESISGCRAFIADPVVVDELQEVARVSGLPQIPRRSIFHALNQKAIARKYALEKALSYESMNLIIAHLGGGISVSAHRLGRVVDTNQALGGFGPFSPERAGTLDCDALVKMCFSGEYSEAEIKKMIVGRGGVVAHLGTNNVGEVVGMAKQGNAYAQLIVDALSYNVAKEIGAMAVVLENKIDAIIITGGIAHNSMITDKIEGMVSFFAPVTVVPGEDELGALAMSGLRAFEGESCKEY